MPMDPRFVARLRANRTLGRHDQNRRVAPPNHNIYYPAITETNVPVADNAATYTAVLPGDTSETDVVYEAADEGAVALADVYNGSLESNGAQQSYNILEYPEFPSFTGEAEVLNGLNISPWDDVSEGPNEPEASVSALANSRAIEEEDSRPTRRTRPGKGRNPAGPTQAKKGKGKERAASTGSLNEDLNMSIRSAADEGATIHPPEVTRPRTRAVVRAEKSAAAAAAADSRQTKGKGRAEEPAPHPPAKNVVIRRGRGQKAKKITCDNVTIAARPDDAAPGPSRRRTRGVKHTVKPRSPSPPPPLVVPDGMRKLRGNRLVSAEPPAPRTRTRRQLKTVPAVKEETVEDKKEEQPKRTNKRTRDDFEGDDAPEDAPPKKRSKHAHTPPQDAAEQLPNPLAEETAEGEAPESHFASEEEETALIVPETHTVGPEVETAESAAPEVSEFAVLEVPAVPAVEGPAPAEEQAAAPPAIAVPQLPAHPAVLPPAFHAVIHPVPNQQIPQGLVPAQPAAIPLNRPLRRSETTLLFGKIYRR